MKLILLLGAVAALVGCGSSSGSSGTGGTPGAGGSGGAGAVGGMGGAGAEGGSGGAGGMGGDTGTPALQPLERAPSYAVISTDFTSTSIAMLDDDFELIDESWVSSGTTYPGLVATLSGDVVLPTRQAGNGTFGVLDRFLTDVATQFYVPSGNLNGQVRTHGDIGNSGFSSNPQDLIFVDERSAWVPRYEANLDPEAAPENQGNDLYELDPRDMTATGRRIDLSSLNTIESVEGMNVETFARPSRGVLIGDTLVVGLDRISAAFDAAGPGAVAIVGMDDEAVRSLSLPGLKNCARVVPIPGTPTKVAVACGGFSNPFGDEAQIRATSGIAIIDVAPTGASVETLWRVADEPSAAISVSALVALDAETVLAVAAGNFVDTTDVLYEVNLETGAQSSVLTSAGSFTLGVSAYNPDDGMLYVPDAAANAVIELAEDGNGFTEVGSTQIAPDLGLPPSQVYLLD